MENVVIPYELPETENHSFFFIDQHIDTRLEAKLHRHDAWELYYVVQGRGARMAGDTLLPFTEGNVTLIPPSMHHHWNYSPSSAAEKGHVHYRMVAFKHSFVLNCMEICAYVMAHYIHPISLDDIATEIGMNRSAFCSYFKRHKGMTFSQFVTRYRLDTACNLLTHSQNSVSEICYLVGFQDVPHFVRVFTKEKGMSPGRYRKKH